MRTHTYWKTYEECLAYGENPGPIGIYGTYIYTYLYTSMCVHDVVVVIVVVLVVASE